MTTTKAAIYRNPSVKDGYVEMGDNNPRGLQQGQAIQITAGDFTQLAKVNVIAGVSPTNSHHISSIKWTGTPGTQADLEKLAAFVFTLRSVKASPKLRIGLMGVIVTIGTSYLNAAITKDGMFQPHLGFWRWIIFSVTILGILVTWLKDVLG